MADARSSFNEEPSRQTGDSPGWRVDPAPDGRGAPPDQKPPLIPRRGSFATFLLAQAVRDAGPGFIDREGLTRLLAEQDVTVNAQPLDDGRGFWTNLMLGFGPTLLLVAFFIWLAQRQASAMEASPEASADRRRGG